MSFLLYFLLIVTKIFAEDGSVSYIGKEYDSHTDTTTFSYSVTAIETLPHWKLEIPQCEELVVTSIIPDFANEVGKGSTVSYNVIIRGLINDGTISYTLGHDKSSFSIDGPVCERILRITCDAGGPYSASCGGRIALSDSLSKHMTSSTWSTDETAVSFSSTTSHSPILTLSKDMCSTSFSVQLTIRGNEHQVESCEAQVSVSDNEPPVFNGLYASDTTVQCDDIPAPSVVTAKDNCDDNVEVLFTEEQKGNNIIERNWMATDFCLQSVTYAQIITVIDSHAPILVGVPEDETLECGLDIPSCTVIADDNCDESIDVIFSEDIHRGSCPEAKTRIRTWTATDSSGHSTSQSQTLSILDNEAPKLLGIPDDVEVSCGELPSLPTVTAEDNCDIDTSIFYAQSTTDYDHANQYVLVHTYTSTDHCGNQRSTSWRISIQDVISPKIHGIDNDEHVNCDEVPAPCEVIVTDNCDTKIDAVYVETTLTGTCLYEYQLVRSWAAVDKSGNGFDQTQTVYVSDTSGPKFTSSIPNVLNVNCDFIPNVNLEAVDNCGSVDIVLTTETIAGSSSVHYALSRKWVASDECGNTNVMTQIVNVKDDQPPVLTGLPPSSFNVACDSEHSIPSVIAIDNCPNCQVDLDLTESSKPGTCGNNVILEREWVATDCGGNSVTFLSVINVVDTEAPKMTGLFGHVVVSVGNIPDVTAVTATDNCQDVTPVFNEETLEGSCLDNYVVVRTWRSTDDCGNTKVHSQSIRVIDNQPPIFTVPHDTTVHCDSIPEYDVVGSDNSGRNVGITMVETRIDGSCSLNYQLVRTYTATDACDNSAVLSSTILVTDTEPPSWNEMPSSYTYYSEPQDAPVLTASDDCQDVSVKFNENKIPHECSTQFTFHYTWNVVDDCGNAATQMTQTVDIIDITPPTFFNLPDASVEADCSVIPPVPVVTATDGGETLEVTFNEISGEHDCTEKYILVRTWTASDCVNNVANFVQSILVKDTQAPALSVPDDIAVSCSSIPVVKNEDVIAIDDCHSTVITHIHQEKIEGSSPNDYILVRSWTATDSCGNAATGAQILTVSDTELPTLSGLPTDAAASCSEVPLVSHPSCSDVCDNEISSPTFSETSTIVEDECSEYTIIRTWTCTDASGNSAIASQEINIADNTSPTFDFPYPLKMTVECNNIPNFLDLSASDNCDTEVSVIKSQSKSQIISTHQFLLIRTWTTVDQCGNENSIQQSVTVLDNEAPVIKNAPSVQEITCPDQPSTPTGVYATDNCDNDPGIRVTTEVIQGECNDQSTVEYSWVGTDATGNVGSAVVAIITIDDNNPPTFIGDVESPITASYTAIPPKLSLEALDECDPNPHVTCSRVVTPKACLHHKTLEDSCVAEDRCGNSISVKRVINVVDDIPPVLSTTPADVTIECPGNVPGVPNVVSEIGIEVLFHEIESARHCEYGYTLFRTWTARDCAQNEVSYTQTITVEDTQPPTLYGVGTDQAIDCTSTSTAPDVTATDVCDPDPHVDMTESIISRGSDSNYDLVRKWVATDVCGLSTEDSQTISVRDTNNPSFNYLPVDSKVENGDVSTPSVTCSDACSSVTVSLEETTLSGTCTHSYTIVRVWKCSDSSGNTISAERTVEVQDSEPPILTQEPVNLILEIGHVPDVANVEATDSIDSVVPVMYSQVKVDVTSDNDFTLLRTWSAMDDCENQVQYTQTIKVIDITPPIIPQVPPDMAATCDFPPSEEEDELLTYLIRAQVAQSDVTIDFTRRRFDGSCPNQYTIVREWTATDLSENVVSATQQIEVFDYAIPSFDEPGIPDSIPVDCASIPDVAEVAAADSCGGGEDGSLPSSVYVAFVETRENGHHVNEYTLTRRWTATDLCGHTNEGQHQIFVSDTIPPTLSHKPAHETKSCIEIDSLDIPEVTASDNCDDVPTIDYQETKGPILCEMSFDIYRTWTTTDTSGLDDSYTQTIKIIDNVAPLFDNLPSDTTLHCSESLPEIPSIKATDNCAEKIDPTFNQQTLGSPNAHAYVRNWHASDPCGNTVDHSQRITIIDDVPPTISDLESSITVECDSVPQVPTRGVSDNCDVSPKMVVSTLRSDGSCPFTYAIVTTWMATDYSGNSVSVFQTVNVQDTISPVLSGLPSLSQITVSCNNIPSAPAGVVTDNCEDFLSLEYSQATLNEEKTDQYWLSRTWKAEDHCGNHVETVQTIIVMDDNELPVFTNVPQDQMVVCDTTTSPETPSVTDNCDSALSVAPVEEEYQSGSCDNDWVLIRKWSAKDSNGNTATVAQTIVGLDMEPPSFSIPPNVEISCDEVPAPENMVASDNCGHSINVVPEEERIDSAHSLDRYTLVRTWTATDECGNSLSKSQEIKVDDTTKPEFLNIPPSMSKSCDEVDSSVPEITAADDCAPEVDITHTIVHSDHTCFFTYKSIHTWVATDRSGNTRIATQILSIYDSTPPVFIVSDEWVDMEIACNQLPSPGMIGVTDNCQTDVSVTMTEDTAFVYPNFIKVRVWNAIDNCGNEAEHSQTVTITDSDPPVLSSVPDDKTLECEETIPFFHVSANDMCDADVDVTKKEEKISGSCPETSSILFTWTSTDVSGNSATAQAIVVLQDSTPPVMNGLPSLSQETYECDNIPLSPSVTATDNCDDNVEVISSESNSQTNSNDVGYEITRSWTATDNCGNSVDASHLIVLEDTNEPVLTCQTCDELFVGCDHIPSPSTVLVEDNCDFSVSIEFSETREDGNCDDEYQLTWSWSSTDISGNSVSITQLINVVDNVAPVLSGIPADGMLECNDQNEAPTVTVTDNCDDTTTITVTNEIIDKISDHAYTTIRSWSATDSCGQSSAETQTLQIVDTHAPILSKYPSGVEVEINEVKGTWPGKITATDNCDGDTPVEFSQERVHGSCRYTFTIIRTWSSIDAVGHIVVHDQTIALHDYTPPLLTGIPDDMIVDYEQRSTIPSLSSVLLDVTATDNSGATIAVTNTEVKIEGECSSTYKLIRTFSAEDGCGNIATASQTIKVVDDVSPNINEPSDDTVECDAIPEICRVDVLADPDHPDYGLAVSFNQNTIGDVSIHQYQLLRMWWVDDCAGNRASFTQTITVQDKTPPVLSRLPADVSSECTCEDSAQEIEAIDNCDATNVVVEMNEIRVESENASPDNFLLYRSWIAVDSSGNDVSYTQTITVTDSSAPKLCEDSLPTRIFVPCDSVPPQPVIKFNDNCDPDVNVDYSEDRINGDCSNTYSLVRSWTATDRTGNSQTHTQTIEVSDDEKPTFLTDSMFCLFPVNGKIAVYQHVTKRLIEAVDNCGDLTVRLQSCNSSQPESDNPAAFPADCAYNSNADTLYVRIERNDGVTAGRVYRLWVNLEDACGNQRLAKKSFWIPYDQSSFEAEDGCAGTGADHFISSLPDF